MFKVIVVFLFNGDTIIVIRAEEESPYPFHDFILSTNHDQQLATNTLQNHLNDIIK